jgi:hypothetical protein
MKFLIGTIATMTATGIMPTDQHDGAIRRALGDRYIRGDDSANHLARKPQLMFRPRWMEIDKPSSSRA